MKKTKQNICIDCGYEMQTRHKYFNHGNLVILLVVSLFAHNIYLQTQIKKAISASKDAEYEAREASRKAEDAAAYASDASDFARNAADFASETVDNSFGNQCSKCP